MYSVAAAFDLKPHRPIITSQPINVVLLDDSKFDRLRIRRMSQATGLPICLDEVGSIAALQALLDLDHFDLVLLDHRMTDGDGIAALDMVRNHPANAHVPTIMVTGCDDPTLPVRAMRLGCQDMLRKADLTAATLKAAVEAALERTSFAHGTARRRRAMVQTVSHAAVAEYRQELQPELTALTAEMRRLGADADLSRHEIAVELERLAQRCETLGAALGDPGATRPIKRP